MIPSFEANFRYLCGNFDEAELQFESLLERARSSLDKAGVYGLRMVQYENMSRYADAIACARESLALFGFSFPDSTEEKQAKIEAAIATIQIAIENAGAERGVFLRETDGLLFIEAEGSVDSEEVRVLEAIPIEQSTHLARGVVYYVHKTSNAVVIGDALSDERFANDVYVARFKPRSILCVPVVYQGKFEGILYLENNLAADAFTTDRIEILRILSSQAAISLESARLYDEMKQEVAQRRRAEDTLRQIVEGTAAVTGGDFFRSMVHHLASVLEARYVFVTECVDRRRTKARTLAFWTGKEFAENVEYSVDPTPCKKVYEGQICFYAKELQKLFPEDEPLTDMGAESFIGIPMYDASGEVIGHLVVMDDMPMTEGPRGLSILKIFAARAGR